MPNKKKPIATAEITITNESTPEPVEPAKRTRIFRSAEARIAELDSKIAFHSRSIEQLEKKKATIGTTRRTRKLTYGKILSEMKASGKTPEEIAALLNG